MSVRWASALGCTLLAGCGSLADASWRGERLFELSGSVLASEAEEWDGELRVALFWAFGAEAREEQAVVVTTEFPARYTLEIYAFPPRNALFEAPWDAGQRYAIGLPLLYVDTDGNGRWEEARGEPLVGGASDVVVVYAEQAGRAPGEGDAAGVPGDDPLTFRTGFQRMLAEGGSLLCADTAPDLMALFPVAEAPTDLLVGEWWESLRDWNCDEGFEEWSEVCPGIDEVDLEAWCQEYTASGGDPDGTACLELCS